MKRIPRRIFTEEFKKEAVRLVQSEGLTMAEAARKLDVTPKSLKTWIDLHRQGALTGSLGVAKLSAEQLRIPHICQMLNVARSGYQSWLSGKTNSLRKQEDGRFTSLIRIAHARGRGTYGPLKIQTELRDATGVEVGINRIKRLRKAAGIRCIHKRKFRGATDSKHTLPIAPNLLNREFNQTSAPNQVWVTDITYIPTNQGWLYLAAVKDLHTGEIAGWAMNERMTKQLVCDALRSAY